jgi:phage host-nuclease inhibitor protein Gam
MARTRIPDAPQLKSWDDVNNALMEIARGEIEIAEIEGRMNIQINAIKEKAESECAPIRAAIAERGRQLKEFAELNRPDFGKSKSKKLTFGSLGWRASTSIVIKKALTEKIIDNLRKLGMGDCVKVKEEINKEILATYPEEKIIASGASVKHDDTFWYETDKQSLQGDS